MIELKTDPAPPPRISQMPYHAPEASPRTPTASMRPAARTSAWWWIAIGVVGLLAGGLTAGAVGFVGHDDDRPGIGHATVAIR